MSSTKDKSLKRKVRNSYIVSTISIAMVLFLMGSVGYLILNASKAAKSMRENFAMHIMLKDGAGQENIDAVGEKLQENPAVRDVKYVSKEEAAKEFKEYIGGDFEEFLAFNPLPDAYEVRLNADSSDKTAVKELETEISSWDGIDEVVYQRTVAEYIGDKLDKFNIILLLFGAILFFIAIVLLNNTLRLTIYSKRYLINTMKLVGASKWFIMKPFIGRSILSGFYAWLISGAMLFILTAALGEKLPEIVMLAGKHSLNIILGGMLVAGVLISLLFTVFAVNKFVNMHSSKIHLY